MDANSETVEILEEVKEDIQEEISEKVEEIAEEIIEEQNRELEELEAINKSIIDAMLNSQQYQDRIAFENRVMDAISEIRNGLEECQSNLEILRSQMSNSSATAETAVEIAEIALETSLIPDQSNHQSADEVDLQSQEGTTINPEEPPSPQPPPQQNLRKRIRRLL